MLRSRRVRRPALPGGRPIRDHCAVARAHTILPVVALVLVVGLGATPVRADKRVNTISRALRADPVFVSSAASRAVPPVEVAKLRRAVAAARLPIFVVVAPSFGGEAGIETFDGLPDLLHDRLERDGIYVGVDLRPSAHAQAFGVAPRFDVGRLSSAVYHDRPDAAPGEAARYAVALLTTGRRAPVAERRLDAPVDPLPVAAAGVGAAGLGFVVAGWPWIAARRRRRRLRAASPGPASSAPEPPRDLPVLRDQAHEELAALAGALAAAAGPPPAAFDAYAAASKLLQDADEDDALSLLAALELMRRAHAELHGRAYPPCFFDPRHGAAKTRTRWRLGGEEADIPACRPCARRVQRGRAPAALQDRGRPYFERDTLWAQTGFGAIADDLPARVLAGEGRR